MTNKYSATLTNEGANRTIGDIGHNSAKRDTVDNKLSWRVKHFQDRDVFLLFYLFMGKGYVNSIEKVYLTASFTKPYLKAGSRSSDRTLEWMSIEIHPQLCSYC